MTKEQAIEIFKKYIDDRKREYDKIVEETIEKVNEDSKLYLKVIIC